MSAGTSDQATVVVETTMGAIEVDINQDAAPVTAANFLALVDAGLYDGGIFHRTVTLDNQPDTGERIPGHPNNAIKIEVIQGGIHPDKNPGNVQSIPLERTTATGLRHLDGVISMGRSDPDSASSEFFFCINDQPELDFGGKRNPDGQGFAAFGRVTSGMDVVRAIQQAPHDGQKLTPPVTIRRIVRTK